MPYGFFAAFCGAGRAARITRTHRPTRATQPAQPATPPALSAPHPLPGRTGRRDTSLLASHLPPLTSLLCCLTRAPVRQQARGRTPRAASRHLAPIWRTALFCSLIPPRRQTWTAGAISDRLAANIKPLVESVRCLYGVRIGHSPPPSASWGQGKILTKYQSTAQLQAHARKQKTLAYHNIEHSRRCHRATNHRGNGGRADSKRRGSGRHACSSHGFFRHRHLPLCRTYQNRRCDTAALNQRHTLSPAPETAVTATAFHSLSRHDAIRSGRRYGAAQHAAQDVLTGGTAPSTRTTGMSAASGGWTTCG